MTHYKLTKLGGITSIEATAFRRTGLKTLQKLVAAPDQKDALIEALRCKGLPEGFVCIGNEEGRIYCKEHTVVGPDIFLGRVVFVHKDEKNPEEWRWLTLKEVLEMIRWLA